MSEIRVVFDCNVLLQATARNNSPSSICLRLAESGIVKLFICDETLSELEEILNRDYIKKRFNFTEEAIQDFINNLRSISEVITKIPKIYSLPRDAADEIYINLAIECEADYIVSWDNDLLDLMSGFDDTSKLFRQKFRPLKIVEPSDFIAIVEERLKKDMSINP